MHAPHFISRSLKNLTPYQSLLVLGVPLAIIEPFKLIAVVVAGDGHFIAGVVVMICAYGFSLFVTERLFTIVKPKLLIPSVVRDDLELVCHHSRQDSPLATP